MQSVVINIPSLTVLGVEVPTWGVFAAVAFLLTFFLLIKQSERRGISHEHMLGVMLSVLLGGLWGGRIGYLLLNQAEITIEETLSLPAIFYDGELSVVGAYFGATILAWFYIRGFDVVDQAKMSMLRLIDTLFYILPFSISIGYLGAFFSGSMQGLPSQQAWSIVRDGVSVHPVALYYAGLYLALFVVSYLLRRRVPRSRMSGFITGMAIVWISIIHTVVPFWEMRDYVILGISAEQLISLGVCIITGIAILVTREHRYQAVKQELVDRRVIF